MAFEPRFDQVIVNDELEKALQEAELCVRQFLAAP
jgi:guanylate kinase